MGTPHDRLGAGVYGSRLAAKLAGVTRRQLGYWVRKGLIRPSIRRAGRGGRDLYAYTDLVEAKVIGRLRKQPKGSLQRIERALAYLREALPTDEHWRTKSLVLQGGVMALMDPGEVVNTTHESPGQAVIAIFLGDLAREILKVEADLGIGQQLEVDARVQGGSPVIKGTRIPTSLIGELIDEGVEPDRIVKMYPGVTQAGIDAATEFERQLAAV